MSQPLVEFIKVSKAFGGQFANQDLSFAIPCNTFHGIVGENGAGKSTAMKLLYGLYQPDSGTIYFNRKPVRFRSPKDAIKQKIGMVHQHFMLVPPLTIWENIVLGAEETDFFLDKSSAIQSLTSLQNEFGFKLDLFSKVETLSLGEQQQVEILKALYRKADLLILDEPTAVLSPMEIISLFTRLRTLVSSGKTVIVITHKLREVLDFTDNVTVMRRGKVVQTAATSSLSENTLSQLIIGKERSVLNRRKSPDVSQSVLDLKSVSTSLSHRKNLTDISLNIQKGQIIGLAGIEGNGQDELVQVLTQLTPFQGEILFRGRPLTQSSLYELRQNGFALIPPDRHQDGLVLNFDNADNLILGHHHSSAFQKNGFLLHHTLNQFAQERMEAFDIRPPLPNMVSSHLSGGNQQKLLLAREQSDPVHFLLACHPTRGVDIGSADFIHRYLMSLANSGTGILLISSDLDELFLLSDRLAVLRDGKLVFEKETAHCTSEELGLWMTGAHP